MRTIEQIKETYLRPTSCATSHVAELFAFTPGDSFTSHFSKVSVIGILFYIFAVAAWTLEKLFDTYKGEMDTRIEEIIPHRPRWYRDKVLAFMKGKTLIADTDRYDTEGMTEDAIAAARVVKHAVAVENRDASLLTIKVAGEKDGKRCRLDAETEAQLAAYIAEIKDAGVRTALVNIDPDRFNCEADVYYDPMLVAETVESACREAVRNYIENLPFNGEYTNMALVDALQTLDGVRIVEFTRGDDRRGRRGRCWLRSTRGASRPRAISTMGDVVLNMKAMTMDKLYDVNFKRLALLLLPTFWRRPLLRRDGLRRRVAPAIPAHAVHPLEARERLPPRTQRPGVLPAGAAERQVRSHRPKDHNHRRRSKTWASSPCTNARRTPRCWSRAADRAGS